LSSISLQRTEDAPLVRSALALVAAGCECMPPRTWLYESWLLPRRWREIQFEVCQDMSGWHSRQGVQLLGDYHYTPELSMYWYINMYNVAHWARNILVRIRRVRLQQSKPCSSWPRSTRGTQRVH